MDLERQKHAPICDALERFKKKRVVPFDVPGHKRGRGNPELCDLLGEQCVGLDVNSMKPLDNLCNPVSVISEAEELLEGQQVLYRRWFCLYVKKETKLFYRETYIKV